MSAEDAKEEKKAVEYEGAAKGKYNWAEKSGESADHSQGEAITKYSWSDGKKQVSIYIELDGLDELADDAFVTDSGSNEVSLTIANLGGKRRRFAMTNLMNEITGVKLQRKMGKNTVVLKLQKKEEEPWFSLQSGGGAAGGDDEEGGGMPGMGGMMGGMGGMMGGMGGMMGGDMGGMDMESLMAGMGGAGGMGGDEEGEGEVE
eukprot:TRINITY_DN4273_c0_g3_i3.p1 TRINITY_DN4273_c0_g3~~TRINITY_DN4273_c0_g3_i3.p1  ORF type:complete len:203 (+),score=85.37 TRINITY_DN4273_c0_g3_i3:63-671(+)